jgi:hypothetical protein
MDTGSTPHYADPRDAFGARRRRGGVNTEAKRIHNIAPRPVRLSFADGRTVELEVRMAEFFQESFQGEGVDAEGRTYRLVSDGTDDPLVAGREVDDGWERVGEVVAVERAETGEA